MTKESFNLILSSSGRLRKLHYSSLSRAEISGTIFEFCFQFPGHSEASEEDEGDSLVYPLLNVDLDLLYADMASVRNGVS